MKKTIPQVILLLIFTSFVLASCSAGNRMSGGSSKKCGCGLNKGFVGY
jgi:predicted small secreted protein